MAEIKRILRYLQGAKDKGLILNPSETLQVDCYVDADFAGLWNVEQDQDSLYVKSRTGYIITFMGCPLTWVGKFQNLNRTQYNGSLIYSFISSHERSYCYQRSNSRNSIICDTMEMYINSFQYSLKNFYH